MSANTVAPEPLAVSAAELADLLGISTRHVANLDKWGRIPAPHRLGRAVRWNVAEVRAWLDSGSPNRTVWEAMRKGGQP